MAARAENMTVFDAEKTPAASIANTTAHWVKGSDLLPLTTDETRGGEKWIKFQYTGKKGIANSRIATPNPELMDIPPGESTSGIKLKLLVEAETPKPILLVIVFEDKSELHSRIYLKKGKMEYLVEDGWRRDKAPYDWNKIRTIFFRMQPDYFVNNEAPVFFLKDISLTTAPTKYKQERKLTILKKQKTQEIVALGGSDGIPDELLEKTIKSQGQKLRFDVNGGGSCPVVAYGAFDATNLYILWEALFSDTPIAGVAEKDGPVYQDEAIELFFSGANDNNKIIQFVANAKGAIFDYYREYDNAACGMVNNIKKDVPHRKWISYKDNTLTYLFSFPLSGLNINYPNSRFFGFQAVQNYKDERQFKNKNISTVKWSSTTRNPEPLDFGALVLNQTKTGDCFMEITSIAAKDLDAKESRVSDFSVGYAIKGLAPGEYKIRAELVDAEHSKSIQEGTVVVARDGENCSFCIPRAKNNIGVYTVYLSVFDTNNNCIVAGANFQNTVEVTSLFGTKFIYPTPKEVVWQDGAFKAGVPGNIVVNGAATDRTKKTAVLFQDMLHGYTGRQYSLDTAANKGTGQIRLKIDQTTVFNAKPVDLKPEGFHIKVLSNEVIITAADEAGLFYGCNTFIKLIKMPMKVEDDAPVPCVEILDWPDYPNRVLRVEPTALHWGAFVGGDKLGAAYFLDLFQKSAVNNNYNSIIWDFSPLVNFQFPELQNSNRALSMEDIRTVTEYCRDRFVQIIPKIQIGGHANWWMGEFYNKFRAKGYKDLVDTTHPEHDRVLYACLDEILNATQAKYLQTGDEWWFSRKSDEEVANPFDKSKTWSQVFLQSYEKLNRYLNEKGARLILFEDMLSPELSGLKNDNYKNVDQLSKNIIISPWCEAGGDKVAAYFLDKGFEVWGNPTYDWRNKDMSVRKRMSGYGPSFYGIPFSFKYTFPYPHYSSVLYGAEFAWNGHRTDAASIPEEICSGKLPEAAYVNSVRQNPSASQTIRHISLKEKANCNFNQILEENLEKYGALERTKEKTIGSIEMDLLQDPVNCIRISKDAPATKIEVGRKCSSLVFLHSAFQKPNAIDHFIQKFGKTLKEVPKWPNGFPCGDYEVEYEDGTSAKAGIRLFNNVYWMDSDPINALITLDNRYVLSKKTTSGQELFLYQWEWVNPCPQKKIASVTCSNTYQFEFEVFLFALSGREARD